MEMPMPLLSTQRILAFCAALIAAGPSVAADNIRVIQTDKVRLQVETLAEGLNHPWAVALLPDGAYVVTERPGRMRIIRNGQVGAPISTNARAK